MHSILAYCLDNIPKSYESTYPIDLLSDGKSGSLEVKILNKRYYNNTLFIEAFALSFNTTIRIIIFNARPYHSQIFRNDRTIFIVGTIELYFEKTMNCYIPTFINPKVTTNINTIVVKFKKKGAKLSAIQSKITYQILKDSKIPEQYAKALHEIFYPTFEFFQDYHKSKGFPKKHIDAIKFCEIFVYIQRLQKKKKYFTSKFQCKGQTDDFIRSLPFTLTKAQYNAIQEIQKDLYSSTACRRIIMGDVGCGKTIVILASVVLAYPYKSMLMAPTTILAKQLYEEAKKYLPSFITISCITSTNSKKDSHILLQGDFVIGTQALLFRQAQANFDDFALVMTDEQHRFGTNTRLQLEKMLTSTDNDRTKKPHHLQFSATPIPRTMAMIQSNLINFTFIKDLPFKKDIQTYIINKSHFSDLIAHIKGEIAKNYQIAIIYPLIDDTQKLEHENTVNLFNMNTAEYQSTMDYAYTIRHNQNTTSSHKIPYMSLKQGEQYWQKNFSNVFSTHGKDKDKDEILAQFANTKGSILLATTMIEVGISLPNLTTIVIVGAERLGLASLHQLRGRVSRNGLKGYCYLYTHHIQNERLNRFAQTLSGFDIAELDLEYRNSGDLLDGTIQSGNNFNFFNIAEDSVILQEAQECITAHCNKNS